MATCEAKTKSGKRCRANAAANGYCSIHEHPEKAAQLSRKAVAARRKAAEDARNIANRTVAAPRNAEELKAILAQSFADLVSGKMNDRTARAVAGLGGTLLRAYEATDTAGELKKLQEMLSQPDFGTRRTSET
jgi:alkanesulfonate monooxygenase SsuD/methylene tetrahydromethanopterin reductase-like flavin-dependent oxidoreductase (luciferase family)